MADSSQSDPSTEEASFIQAIQELPQSDHLRLVYADWLEEQGDSRCEYLRTECEFAEYCRLRQQEFDSDTAVRFYRLRKQLKQQRSQLPHDWLCQMSRSQVACCSQPVRFELECPLTWDGLTPTDDPGVRHCHACEAPVYFETDPDKARARAANHECVCLPIEVPVDDSYQQAFDRPERELMGEVVGFVDFLEADVKDEEE